MALFDGLMGRATERARQVNEAALRRAEAAFAEIRGARLHREGDALVVEGTGLARRWLGDAGLRFALWRQG